MTNYGYLHSESGLFLDEDRQSVRLSSFTTRVIIATEFTAVYQRPIMSQGINSKLAARFKSVV